MSRARSSIFQSVSTPDVKRRKRPADIAERFIRRVKELREEKGWTQAELAEKLGVKRTSAANYEQGISFPPLPTLDRMARLFGVSLDALVWGEEPPEQAIRDRDLLKFFKRLDALDYRAKAALMEIMEAVLFKEEHACSSAVTSRHSA